MKPAKAMTIRLSAEQAEALETVATVADMPVSDVIRAAITEHIEARRKDPFFQEGLNERMLRASRILRDRFGAGDFLYGRAADAVLIGDRPKPILIKIGVAACFLNAIRCALENREADRRVIVPCGVSEPIRLNGMRMKRRGPGLRRIVRHSSMGDFGRGTEWRQTRSHEPDEGQSPRCAQAHARLGGEQVVRNLLPARLTQEGLCEGALRAFGGV